jgi:hypothetical protein
MSVSKAAEFDKMLEGEDQKEESLHDLFGKGSDDQAGDDESDEEEEEEEEVKEEEQVQAVKFNLAELDDVSRNPACGCDSLNFSPGGNRQAFFCCAKTTQQAGTFSFISSTALKRQETLVMPCLCPRTVLVAFSKLCPSVFPAKRLLFPMLLEPSRVQKSAVGRHPGICVGGLEDQAREAD